MSIQLKKITSDLVVEGMGLEKGPAQVVQVSLFSLRNGDGTSLRVWREKINHCWLSSSRSWFGTAGDASAQSAALSDKSPYCCRLQQLDDENSELRSCVPCLRANIERLEEVRMHVCVCQSFCPPHSSGRAQQH